MAEGLVHEVDAHRADPTVEVGEDAFALAQAADEAAVGRGVGHVEETKHVGDFAFVAGSRAAPT